MTVRNRMVTALILCLHFIVVSTSPTPSWSLHRPRKHVKWMWARQARQKLPPRGVSSPANHSQEMKANHAPYHLPPVSKVFKMMADVESRQSEGQVSPTATHQVLVVPSNPPFPTFSKVGAALAPATTIVQPSSPASYHELGLLASPQSVVPEAHVPEHSAVVGSFAPTGSTASSENSRNYPNDITAASQPKASDAVSSVGPMETGTILDAAQPTSMDTTPHGTASRLLMICAVMASLIAMMFLAYFILNYRLFAFCRRKKQETDSWTKIASPPPPGTYQGAEKEIAYQTPRSQRSASSVYSSHKSEGSASVSNTRLNSIVPDEVIDISSNYPRSKFSLCSSEYPVSISSQSSTISDLAPLPKEQVDSPTLSPAYDCYQSSQPSEDNRHSRTHSEPILRPDVNGGPPYLLIRAIQHRRSRSISGLTYTVKQEHRESGSSGYWTESPPSISGWPSAL